LEFEQSGELLDFLLHLGHLAGLALSVGLLGLALGHGLLRVLGSELALGTLLAKVIEAGRVDPFAPEQLAEFTGSVAGIGFF
jgi:hypothetical protein